MLQQEAIFCSTNLADQIALLAIYIPILRTEMQSFVRTWNIHSIRRQPKRPNVVPGKPNILYHHSPEHISNYGLSVDDELLQKLQGDVQEWGKNIILVRYLFILMSLDMEEYLPASTLQWCQDQLQTLKLDISQPPSDPTTPYYTIYLQLRTALNAHLIDGNLAELSLSAKPTGSLKWQPVSVEAVQEMDLAGDNVDEDTESSLVIDISYDLLFC
jgi:hypothetical protein